VGSATLLEWVVDRLEPHFAEVLVSVASPSVALPPALEANAVYDLHQRAGPLGGVEAALAATGHDVVFVVACDMPRVSPRLARALVAASMGHDAAVPRLQGRPEPTCAAYRRSAAGPIGAALRAERLKAAHALGELDVRYLDDAELEAAGATPNTFANLNTPADYQEFLAGLRRRA
jgi:molybdopterin-guanine dinucleotide biosynthesis protein A